MREIDTLGDFSAWLAEGPGRPAVALQALDLRNQPRLAEGCFDGCLFLGCQLEPTVAGHLVMTGALVIPADDERPFPIHRAFLYTAEELFAGFEEGGDYHETLDYRVYRWFMDHGGSFPKSIAESLARSLHDHSISDALDEALEGCKVVAIMGGHAMERRDPAWARVARIARTLARQGYTLISGGGPGAMEATHVGAWFAHFPDAELTEAIGLLSVRPAGGQPGKEYLDPDWLARAMKVRARWPLPDPVRFHSVGIPTWHYGHEPPTPFATKIAKYFANSIREEGLLAVANHGVIFAPGSAGTTQEIFQDAAQNHYGSYNGRSPMVLLDREFWTTERPVWPLLEKVSEGKVYDELLFLTDDEDAVVRRIRSYAPEVYGGKG